MRNKILLILSAALMCFCQGWGLELDTYASQSRLATGKWVKVSVPESGMYLITNAQLRQWGFNDPSKVRVYGYGGQRIASLLSSDTYIDDLPLAQHQTTDKGIVFYGVGPESWTLSSGKVIYSNNNIYTTKGYYFLSDNDEEARDIPEQGLASATVSPATKYTYRSHYELDRVSPGEAGYLLVGESFKAQPTRKFSFDMPATSIKMECAIVSNSTFSSQVSFTVNGQALPEMPADKIPATAVSGYLHGTLSTTVHEFDIANNKLDLTISIPNAPSMKDCWLDYIAFNAKADIKLSDNGILCFYLDNPSVQLAAPSVSDVSIWDVTNPLNISALRSDRNDNQCYEWTNDYTGQRTYAAWHPNANFPSPTYEGVVANQDIHSAECANMVIFTLPEYAAQAQRIADMHHNSPNPLNVAVLNVNQVYNEFASGSPDISALRKCLKMFYDRGEASGDDSKLRYALLLGRSTYDNRRLTSQFDSPTAYGTIPQWLGGERRYQLSDNTAYGTDDFIAMLEDNSGLSLGSDQLCIAVGRMPARSVEEMKGAVDKLSQYIQKSKTGTWKNSFLFLADDGNMGIHADQTEAMIHEMLNTPDAQNFISKVYVDAYDIIGGTCVGGRNDMYRMLNEGTMWWNYCGHANNHTWTSEGMLTYYDINNLYLTRIPVLMAATCDFLRWDSNTLSGGEIFFHERYGGTIATISATRPVYITDNGYFTRAVGRAINKRNPDGTLPRLGDIYRNAKNDIRTEDGTNIANTNRLRYVLMGDPAMQLAMPHNIVRLETINGVPVNDDTQPTLMALQRTEATGSVVSPQGELLTDFDGIVEVVIYDAEHSFTTKGRGDDNVVQSFEQHGDRLFAGSAPVEGGKFKINLAMPAEVADNFRPATMNMYAYSQTAEAVGVNREFYVYGLDDSVEADQNAPKIETLVLNHSSFQSGDAVNESPMVIANISDDIGINLSSSGVGHQMTITIDGNRVYNDVSLYFTPATDGSPSGTINYPLEDITTGEHTLRLRIWDTSGNSASQEIAFMVSEGLSPTIYEIYCDANPASTEANFYISHDRPDREVSVTISVYSLLGRKVWESSVTGRSDMFLSAPVTWDLCDMSGRRVQRGIYLYRATISAGNGDKYDTGSRKLAVTAQ